jgi:predicted RNase H-like nuclease (RuvC/YqgF family)
MLHLEAGYPRREILAKMLLSEEGQRNARSFPGRSLLLLRYRLGQMFRWLPFVKARRLQRDRLLACLRRAATAQAATEDTNSKVQQLAQKVEEWVESTLSLDQRLRELSDDNANLKECLDVLEKRHLHALVENMMLLVSRQSALEIQLRQKLPSDAADIADLSRKLRELASVIEAGKPRG